MWEGYYISNYMPRNFYWCINSDFFFFLFGGVFCVLILEIMKKVKHLLELPKASTTHLIPWKADLNEEGRFDEAIKGCNGVFLVATPMDFESKDPEVWFWVFTSKMDAKFISYIVLSVNKRIWFAPPTPPPPPTPHTHKGKF